MKLILSGGMDSYLPEAVAQIAKPRKILRVRDDLLRMEDVESSSEARSGIAELCERARVDHAFIERDQRFSDIKLLALDMDSTLITIECIDEIADFVGKKKEVAAITEAVMRGEITDFNESLRQRVKQLKGTPINVLRRVFEERLRLSNGAYDLIKEARNARIHTILVSGGFTYFTDRLQEALKFDRSYSNVLEIAEGKLTGQVEASIIGPIEKAYLVKTAMQEISCTPEQSIVIGDGANDIPMMRCVKHSFAFHAKPAVTNAARYAVKFGSLTTVRDFFT